MNHTQEMGTLPISKLLVRFAVPAVFSLVLHGLYNIVDRIFIGQGVGELGLAGVAICFPILLLIFGVCLLFSTGAGSLISLYLGQDRIKDAEEVLGNMFVLLIIAGIVMTGIGLAGYKQIVGLFLKSSAVTPHAHAYIRVLFSGSIFFLFGFAMNFVIRAQGHPVYATMMIVVGTLINVALDPLFIFVFQWGTAGAALATILSEILISVLGIAFILKGKGAIRLRPEALRLSWPIVKQITYLGASPALMDVVASIQFGIMNERLLRYGGEQAVAAMGIIFAIAALIMLFTFGMAGGMQPIIGYNYGAKQFARVVKTFQRASSITFAVAIMYVACIMLFSESIAQLFAPHNPSLVALSSHGMRIFLCMIPFVTVQILGARYFQAVGKGGRSIMLGLSRQLFLFVPLLFILTLWFDLDGVWLTGPVADFSATFITVVMLLHELRRVRALSLTSE